MEVCSKGMGFRPLLASGAGRLDDRRTPGRSKQSGLTLQSLFENCRPNVDWQLTLSLLIVAAAAIALVRRTVSLVRGEGETSCGGCSKGCDENGKAEDDPELAGFVPEERLTIHCEDESAGDY
jgi:hypothetical protein